MTDILKSILAAMVLAGVLFSLAIAATALADDESEAERLVNEAVEFWSGRTSATAQAKLAYFTLIRDALTSGDVSDALMARVTASWEGANPGGRMYATWEAAFNALTALREAATVEEVPEPEVEAQEDEQQEPEFDLSELEIPPPADDQEVVQLSEDVPVRPDWYSPPKSPGTPAPAWFNPGGGYTQGVDDDGHAGLWTHQFPGNVDEFKATTMRPSNVTADIYTPEGHLHTGDGIPDWSYESYEDAQINEAYPGRNFAKLGWGPWGDLSAKTRAAILGIELPSSAEIAGVLGVATKRVYGSHQNADIYPEVLPSGTATYEGEAVGVFRPDLFGTVYGTKDDPSTADKNEYDDGGPRVSLTANFDKGLIDGELTARMTAQRLGFGPPVREYLIRNRGLGSGYRWHSAHSHFFECPDSTCAATYTAVRADSRNDGDYTYVHGRIETTVDVDEMLRTPVVRWNGVRMRSDATSFEGQGLYGEAHGTCAFVAADQCGGSQHVIDSSAAITGYINHPRFVGSYGAAKCASDGTCPGFEMPDLVPGTVTEAYDAWGSWDDLPLATRQDIAGTATVADMTGKKKHTGDNRTFWLPDGTGIIVSGPIRETWWSPVNMPSSGTATWRTHGDSFDATINPAYSGLSDPILTLTADFANSTIGAGITFMESGARTAALESWSGLSVTNGGFSGDGLTGQFHKWHAKYQFGQFKVEHRSTGADGIFGTVNADRVVGTYQAQRD